MQDRRENEADAPCSSYTEYPRELRARRPTRVCYVGRLAAGCRLIPLRDLSASIGELLKSPVGELLSVAQRQRDRTAGSAAGCATVPYCAQISRKGRNEALAPAIPASSWPLFVPVNAGFQMATLGLSSRVSAGSTCSVDDPLDNAVAESFFATPHTEPLDRHSWPTRQGLETAIFEYIEVFYNHWRRHSALSYLSPVEFERRHAFRDRE